MKTIYFPMDQCIITTTKGSDLCLITKNTTISVRPIARIYASMNITQEKVYISIRKEGGRNES